MKLLGGLCQQLQSGGWLSSSSASSSVWMGWLVG